jgi:hypothetical protein
LQQSLILTDLLQVVLSDLSRLVIHKLVVVFVLANCLNNLQQACKLYLVTSLIFSTCINIDAFIRLASSQQACCKLMTSTSLLQLVDNLQQAGKIRDLQQVCGVSGCVVHRHLIQLFQLRLSPEQSGKVEYERERLLGFANI